MLRLYNLDQRTWKWWGTAASQCERRLTEQQITAADPGTILRDVETLIEFVGPKGIATKGRNANLPSDRLPELNQRVGHSIRLDLHRALLRDYPNLSGIFILLRVMELLQVKGSRLIVCPSALELWRGLNPTEQYFALLEALLFQAQSTVLGGQRTREEAQAFRMTALFLGQLSERWCNFDYYESVSVLGPHGELPPWNLFVQQQLGLIELRPLPSSSRKPTGWGGRGWLVGAARRTDWGTAVTWALLKLRKKQLEQEDAETEDEQESANGPDESRNSESAEKSFGMLQPVFQPYFPEWRTVYTLPTRDVRLGTHTFKVTLAGWRGGGGGIWRRLLVPPDASLDELAEAIRSAFGLDDDHLYDFRYRDQRGRTRVYNHPYTDEGPVASEITIAETELALKNRMLFTFDYGDRWQFEVLLEAVDASRCRPGRVKVIDSAGKAPKQYPGADS